uniref:Uncharacterized protein n=1 Tax=Anguilla anguilla TaxID=7936 RepID=A0A0E9XLS5_ANGAN
MFGEGPSPQFGLTEPGYFKEPIAWSHTNKLHSEGTLWGSHFWLKHFPWTVLKNVLLFLLLLVSVRPCLPLDRHVAFMAGDACRLQDSVVLHLVFAFYFVDLVVLH